MPAQGELMSASTLRRYTNLAATIHCLRNKCLTLLNPASWDDRNDAFFLAEYKRRTGVKTVLALYFAEASETYHHWRVFSPGSDGVCLEFDKDRLLEALRRDNAIAHRKVCYREINDVCAGPIQTNDLPYIKRYPYGDEQEFRLVFTHADKQIEAHSFDIPLSCISRITLSPWLPKPLEKSVKDTIKQIDGCKNIRVYRSTLIENERWKKAANPELDVKNGR